MSWSKAARAEAAGADTALAPLPPPQPQPQPQPQPLMTVGRLRRFLVTAIGGGSLHRQLLWWLLLPQLVLWLAAAFVTYNVAARYADRGIDASLLQASRSLARQVKPIGSGLLIDFPRAAQNIIEADPDDQFYYMVSTPPGQFILGNRQLPLPPEGPRAKLREPTFYDGSLDGVRLRLAALYLSIGTREAPQLMLVQIARSQTRRDVLARSILLDTVLPLSCLIVLMTMIVWAGIRAGLSPLARLRRLVEARAPNDLAPLSLQVAPQEVRALAQALNVLLAAVGESVASQRRFTSHAAHQLRTPLAGLKSQTELALAEVGDQPALRQRLQRVHDSAVRSARLVNQLMALTRAEPEAIAALPSEQLSLHALVVGVVAELVPQALQAGIDLGVEGDVDEADATASGLARPLANDPAGPFGEPAAAQTSVQPPGHSPVPVLAPGQSPARRALVVGNPLLLREALLNLVDNAIRYAGSGAEVTVAVRVVANSAVISVRDNGPGLTADQRDAVFGRFVRATQEGSGCGLGLAIVREIAERHGGSVTLQAQAPHGLAAELRLPLAPVVPRLPPYLTPR